MLHDRPTVEGFEDLDLDDVEVIFQPFEPTIEETILASGGHQSCHVLVTDADW